MSQRLPMLIDPFSFAERQRQLSGNLDISSMSRLASMLGQHTGQVAIDLAFFKENGQAVIQGDVKTELMLECQNCLETLIWPVDKQFKLGIVSSIDEVNRLPDEYEPLIVEENTITLAEMVEEELMLNIPSYPKHQHACITLKPSGIISEKPKSRRDNPFSILEKLKKTGDK